MICKDLEFVKIHMIKVFYSFPKTLFRCYKCDDAVRIGKTVWRHVRSAEALSATSQEKSGQDFVRVKAPGCSKAR